MSFLGQRPFNRPQQRLALFRIALARLPLNQRIDLRVVGLVGLWVEQSDKVTRCVQTTTSVGSRYLLLGP